LLFKDEFKFPNIFFVGFTAKSQGYSIRTIPEFSITSKTYWQDEALVLSQEELVKRFEIFIN